MSHRDSSTQAWSKENEESTSTRTNISNAPYITPLKSASSFSPGPSKEKSLEKADIETIVIESQLNTDSTAAPVEVIPSVAEKLPEEPYHVFTLSKKKRLILIVSVGAMFSPLTSNIYFPALDNIADKLYISNELVTLSITIFMVVQGIAPSIWGALSDIFGRRVIFIGTFAVFMLANIALAVSNSFTTLMVFRGLQAAGSAATISIGAGVIGDITEPAERGGLIGIFGGIRMFGQSFGPVLGGVLAQFLGWRSLFWFLFIAGGFSLLSIIVLLPETLRRVAGNGSVALAGFHRPLLCNSSLWTTQLRKEKRPRFSFWNVVAPLKMLLEKDVAATLLFGAVVYAAWSMVTTSTTSIFLFQYHYTESIVGLMFLPNGAGCVLGSFITGKLMDRDYKYYETRYRTSRGLPEGTAIKVKNHPEFPASRARLRNMWWVTPLFLISLGTYGPALLASNPAPALICQFVIAFTSTSTFSMNSALMVDFFTGSSASATAVNNLVRCSIGAAGVSVIQIMISSVGKTLTFPILAAVVLLLVPLVVMEWFWGEQWRMERLGKLHAMEKRVKEKAEGGEDV